MVIVPWCRGGNGAEEEGTAASAHNPFDGIFHKPTSHDQTSSVVYSNFIRKVFMDTPTDVALFVDRGIPSSISTANASNQHPFSFPSLVVRMIGLALSLRCPALR